MIETVAENMSYCIAHSVPAILQTCFLQLVSDMSKIVVYKVRYDIYDASKKTSVYTADIVAYTM